MLMRCKHLNDIDYAVNHFIVICERMRAISTTTIVFWAIGRHIWDARLRYYRAI